MIKIKKVSATSILRKKPWKSIRFDQKDSTFLLYDFYRFWQISDSGRIHRTPKILASLD